MTQIRLRQLWQENRPALNGWISLPEPGVGEIMAAQGWDALTIDRQHGLIGYQAMVALLRAIGPDGPTPLVRVPWNSPGDVMHALDAGAHGIICPMVNNRAEAEAFVGACRYPPLGYRSFGPARAAAMAGRGVPADANSEVLALAMIETAEGLENLDAIVSTPGLDGVYIGPTDLSLSLGGPARMDNPDPGIQAVFKRIADAAHAAGIKAGIHTGSAAYSKEMLALGFDLVTVGSDAGYLQGARRDLKTMREG